MIDATSQKLNIGDLYDFRISPSDAEGQELAILIPKIYRQPGGDVPHGLARISA